MFVSVGSGTESDSDESVPELEEQDSTQATTQQAQVKDLGDKTESKSSWVVYNAHWDLGTDLTSSK